jgi:phosphatidylglycerol:prolipoprotein diacylglycerol transferase
VSAVLPYVELPEIVLIPAGAFGAESPAFSIKPFGVLVATGVYLGAWLALGYGRRRGLLPKALGSFIVWVVVTGFVCGHVLDVAFYTPERIARDPWVLLRLWESLSSFGGFAGGALGALLWRARYRAPVLPYADAVASALPVGWVFGRAACAIVHDHPGIPSDAWFAVAYPGGARLDLGLLELLMVLPIALTFLVLRRRAWPWGFFVAALAAVYAPLRFLLDFLRIADPVQLASDAVAPDRRYLALTPAQWMSLLLAGFGVLLLVRTLARRELAGAYDAPAAPASFRASNPDA